MTQPSRRHVFRQSRFLTTPMVERSSWCLLERRRIPRVKRRMRVMKNIREICSLLLALILVGLGCSKFAIPRDVDLFESDNAARGIGSAHAGERFFGPINRAI